MKFLVFYGVDIQILAILIEKRHFITEKGNQVKLASRKKHWES